MSLASGAIAERGVADASTPVGAKVPPPKRTLTALADPRQAPEPR